MFGWRSVGTEKSAPATVSAKTIIVRCTFCLQGTNVGLHESRKTIVSNQTLVLQSILRRGSGSYRCIASNVRGKTKSNAYHLDVKCKYAIGSFRNEFRPKIKRFFSKIFECRSRRLKNNKILPSVREELDDWDLLMCGRSCWVEAWDEGSRFQIVGNESDGADEDDLKKGRPSTSYKVKNFVYFLFFI